ncbi:diacylglycerol kinase family enzyme [Alkalibacillus flavidus]|uniref:Diacylglycerol kinase family enzyme n=1 Tax=Alkalibacillus flavidus TaxID=546021 RepID=A0ABV2KVV0_9BACI
MKVFDHPESINLRLGRYESDNQLSYFTTSIGVGLDADVAETVNQKRKQHRFINSGNRRSIYMKTTFQKIIRGKTKNLSLNVDGSCIKMNNTWLVTVNRLPYFGICLPIAPKASWTQQDFVVTTVNSLSRWLLLLLLPTILIGQHSRLKSVNEYRGSVITIEADTRLTFQTDGTTGRAKRLKINSSNRKQTFIR